MQTLQWNTGEEHSQKIISDGCDAHKINTVANIASGTSQHVENLISELGQALKLLHGWMVEFTNYKALQEVLDHVRKENGRVKTPRVKSSVVTRWNSAVDETECANAN